MTLQFHHSQKLSMKGETHQSRYVSLPPHGKLSRPGGKVVQTSQLCFNCPLYASPSSVKKRFEAVSKGEASLPCHFTGQHPLFLNPTQYDHQQPLVTQTRVSISSPQFQGCSRRPQLLNLHCVTWWLDMWCAYEPGATSHDIEI
jgi:hypothetical protein